MLGSNVDQHFGDATTLVLETAKTPRREVKSAYGDLTGPNALATWRFLPRDHG